MSETIIATFIGGGFTVIVALINKSRRENKTDHNMVVRTLERVEGKLDNHIDNHAQGKFD